MNMYQLKLMSGEKFNISKEEVNLLSGKNGLVFIQSLNGFINISSVSSILPLEIIDSDRKKDEGRSMVYKEVWSMVFRKRPRCKS